MSRRIPPTLDEADTLIPIECGGCAPPVYVSPPFCVACFDTGWAPMPHSDEATMVCTCPAGDRIQSALRPA